MKVTYLKSFCEGISTLIVSVILSAVSWKMFVIFVSASAVDERNDMLSRLGEIFFLDNTYHFSAKWFKSSKF